jgi:hypothetical protein
MRPFKKKNTGGSTGKSWDFTHENGDFATKSEVFPVELGGQGTRNVVFLGRLRAEVSPSEFRGI